MKKDIHPKYNKKAIVACACGATFAAGSTEDEITTELCSKCHPFYTGKQKLVDTAGRVDKFKAQETKVKTIQDDKAAKRAAARKAYAQKKEDDKAQTQDAKAAGKAKKEAKKKAAAKKK